MRFNLNHSIAAAALIAALASPASAQIFSQNAADYNQPFGMSYGHEITGFQPMGRDANGNRVIINGMILEGGDLSNVTGAGYMADGASLFGAPSALAMGNSLNVITQGSWNTVIIDSTQINTGDISAGH